MSSLRHASSHVCALCILMLTVCEYFFVYFVLHLHCRIRMLYVLLCTDSAVGGTSTRAYTRTLARGATPELRREFSHGSRIVERVRRALIYTCIYTTHDTVYT